MSTYTLDARTPDGILHTDRGLTAEQVAAARTNAPRMGIEILAVFDESIIPDAGALRVFGVPL